MRVYVCRINPFNLAFLCFQVGSLRSTAAAHLPFHLFLPRFAQINMASGDEDDPIIEEVCPRKESVASVVVA